MKKKKVILFNRASRAAAYGIGTYLEQYIKGFRKSGIDFSIVNLAERGAEVRVEKKDGYQEIWIPSPADLRKPNMGEYYARNSVYLLREIIGQDKNTDYIFHLNFMGEHHLISSLKKMFDCKIVLVAHYSGWDFALEGDHRKLQAMLADNSHKRKEKLEADVLNDIQQDKKTIAGCDHFVCVSQYMKDLYSMVMDMDKVQTSIVHNALQDVYKEMKPSDKLAIRRKYHIEPQTKVLLYAGRLDPMKGISPLLAAFRKVLQKHSDVRLVMAGDGDFSRWMREAGDCWSKISFTGRIDKKQLYELYSIADMGIVASLCEPFGLVATEMMMHGLPVVASEAGGLSEIIEDGVSGLKVPVAYDKKGARSLDTGVLAANILRLIDNPALCDEIGANGRSRFLDRFGLQTFREAMLAVYNQ